MLVIYLIVHSFATDPPAPPLPPQARLTGASAGTTFGSLGTTFGALLGDKAAEVGHGHSLGHPAPLFHAAKSCMLNRTVFI